MGVVYKLREDVVHFILSQRQSNPLASCRQLADAASQKFSLNLSKSSVHGILKESGILMPKGRKPTNKFKIPQEKKVQIQKSLAEVKLLPKPGEIAVIASAPQPVSPPHNETAIPTVYEDAGKIFLKAALWDLGVFEENIEPEDWSYYLTYTRGVRVVLENDKSFFIDMALPLERCIREVADGFINNIRPFKVGRISDKELFEACMRGENGFKIAKITIVDHLDHILSEFIDIVVQNRHFEYEKIEFVECKEKDVSARAQALFFAEIEGDYGHLWGYEEKINGQINVTLLIEASYDKKMSLQKAAEKLNVMYIYNKDGELLRVKIQEKLA
jgi:hypothetical protein